MFSFYRKVYVFRIGTVYDRPASIFKGTQGSPQGSLLAGCGSRSRQCLAGASTRHGVRRASVAAFTRGRPGLERRTPGGTTATVTIKHRRTRGKIIFNSSPLSHFAVNLSSAAKSSRYSSVVSTLLGRADRCNGEFRVRLKPAGSPLPSNRGERDRRKIRIF
jgi:hypothetical protein